ncbi:CgeB family protein [Dyella sp. KRB-257]|uniref:CgeB family protein n=1 Tax=Dyella sp. KRB-257 TaxID=3400915 RepID=UPI003C100568
MPSRVLVCGASPDNQNRNTVLRSYVVEGFAQLQGIELVYNVPLEYAAEKSWGVRPELVVCFGSCMPDDADYSHLRSYCNKTGTPMVFWLHDDPYEFDYNYKLSGVADIIFSNDRWCAEHYDHPNTYHLPLAASETFHYRKIDVTAKNVNVFFCGVAFANRVRLLRDLAKPLAEMDATILGADWPASELPFCRNTRLPNAQLSDHYARSWITLNMGRDFHYANDRFRLEPSTPGPRTFEAAMAGTTQAMFVESLEIMDYYQPGSEFLLYDSVAEFTRHMAEMTRDRQRCLSIAQAAQQRTLRDHTYKCRAETMLRQVSQCQ